MTYCNQLTRLPFKGLINFFELYCVAVC